MSDFIMKLSGDGILTDANDWDAAADNYPEYSIWRVQKIDETTVKIIERLALPVRSRDHAI